MNYCPRCGVALSEEAARCPLCGGAPVGEKPPAADAGGVAYPGPEDGRPESSSGAAPGPARRRLAVELLSVSLGIALAVTLLADLFANRAITWSRYSSVVLAGVWLASALPVILRRHLWLLFAALAPSLVLLVFLMDVLDGRADWFLGYGLPIALGTEAAAAAAGALVGAQRRRGVNAVAVFLCGAAGLCFVVETTVDLNRSGALSWDWSAVAAFALLPTAALLFYLHYRVLDRASLRKLFRV